MIFLAFSARTLSYPYSVNYTEGHVLSMSVLLEKFGTYFFDINDYPYIHAIYPPVFPSLIAFFIPVVGPSYSIGRLISFIAAIIIVVFLYKVFVRESPNKALAAIFALLFLTPSFVMEWATYVRVDMLALMLSFVGIYLYCRYKALNSQKRYWSILFFLLAFFTKQNAVLAPLTILLYLFFTDRKEFAKFATLYLLPLALIFLFFNHSTDGQFYLHLITYTKSIDFRWNVLFSSYLDFIKNLAVFFIASLFFLMADKRYRIFALYFALNLLFLISIGKEGAGVHYYLEPFLSVMILSGLAFFFLISHYEKYAHVLLLSMLAQIYIIFPFEKMSDVIQHPFTPSMYEQTKKVNIYVEKHRGMILSEYLDFLVTNNAPIFYESHGLKWISRYGLSDSKKLIDDCNNKKFSLIIAGHDILDRPELNSCIGVKYRPIDYLDYFYGGYNNFYDPLVFFIPR